jgi:hypothetical protein
LKKEVAFLNAQVYNVKRAAYSKESAKENQDLANMPPGDSAR